MPGFSHRPLELSVAGDQLDMSRKQSSKAFYVLLKRAGDTPEMQDSVAQKMVELAKETPGEITPENIAPFRARHDAPVFSLTKVRLERPHKNRATHGKEIKLPSA